MRTVTKSAQGCESAPVSIDGLSADLHKIKEQVSGFGSVVQNIIDEIQNVPDGRAVDAFRRQVLQKQMVLETLVEENSCELELLKHDVAALNADVRELKAEMQTFRGNNIGIGVAEKNSTVCQIEGNQEAVDALRRHPLSSIPPRQLNESEAIRFLQAIDEIMATYCENEDLNISASRE